MFSSRKYSKSINDVPQAWMFKYYLGLPYDFTGRPLKVKSIFNENDKTPSMFIYYNEATKRIVFKCHSTSKAGDGIKLVEELYELDYTKACEKIVNDYYEFCKTGKYITPEMKNTKLKWSILDWKVRNWCKHDAEFWLQYNIGSSLLEKFNVKPLEYYVMGQVNLETGEVSNLAKNEGNHIYGYFTNGKIYKAYNPKAKRFKFFLEDGNYVQGSDQAEGRDTLVIASSLKDVMTIKSLGLTVDCIAPNSESIRLNASQIEKYKKMYKHVVVCMDSDEAGITSMKYYDETYKLPFIYLPREKDISDIVKHHGKDVALQDFYPKLQRAIERYLEKNP